ncbi:MAG TPA: LL-diaminopimelate aminotransferase [Gaiellaceae bacterium]|nr:LL-diaminopimelate aminotransferase [Gaiellaceae bacterium]
MRFAKRLDLVPPYLFAELERKIEEKRRAGVDVISLGIGDPDLPTPEPVVRALQSAAADSATHRYPTNRGLEPFREAIAAFHAERFAVQIDPATEVVPVLGGKEGVAHIAFACLDPGDVALAPEPGYPPYTSGPLFAGADVHYLPLRAENEFMPELDTIPDDVTARANLLFLNYPNNPTGAVVAPGFFDRAVEFARAHDLIVVHDNAYSEVAFDGYEPPSFLATAGARDVGVEIFSLSKGWNMTGWRVGWVAGNADVVEQFRRLKTNLDSGMFDALQVAGVAALTEARDFPAEMSAIYRRRRDLMIEALAGIGLPADPPQATPYIWVRVPDAHTSETFTELVLEEAGVVVSPGPSFGPSGEGYVRISLTVADERLEEAASRMATSLRVEAGA